MLTSFMDGPLAQVATCSHGSARTDDHAISLHFVKPAPGGDLRSFRPKKLAAAAVMHAVADSSDFWQVAL